MYHVQTSTIQQVCGIYKPLDNISKAPAATMVTLSHLPTSQCPLLMALVRRLCVSFSHIACNMQHPVCMQSHVAQLIPSLHICTVFAVHQLQKLRCRSLAEFCRHAVPIMCRAAPGGAIDVCQHQSPELLSKLQSCPCCSSARLREAVLPLLSTASRCCPRHSSSPANLMPFAHPTSLSSGPFFWT